MISPFPTFHPNKSIPRLQTAICWASGSRISAQGVWIVHVWFFYVVQYPVGLSVLRSICRPGNFRIPSDISVVTVVNLFTTLAGTLAECLWGQSMWCWVCIPRTLFWRLLFLGRPDGFVDFYIPIVSQIWRRVLLLEGFLVPSVYLARCCCLRPSIC